MAYRTPNKLIKTNYRVFAKLIELKANKFTLIIYYFGVEGNLWTVRFLVCRETNLPLTTGDLPICECVVNWTKKRNEKEKENDDCTFRICLGSAKPASCFVYALKRVRFFSFIGGENVCIIDLSNRAQTIFQLINIV